MLKGALMAEGPTYLYALFYEPGILTQVQFVYVTPYKDEAFRYSREIYPGTTVVQMEVATNEL
jgi:hypothetical protein